MNHESRESQFVLARLRANGVRMDNLPFRELCIIARSALCSGESGYSTLFSYNFYNLP